MSESKFLHPPIDQAALRRQRAEVKFRANEALVSAENLTALSLEEVQRMVHELRVHQIELEMQNEELRRAHEAADLMAAEFFELYDLAPVGYLSLSREGLIAKANLKATELLGVTRGALVRQPLSRFIVPEDQDIYYLHKKQLVETGELQSCELRLVRQGGEPLWVRMEATGVVNATDVSCRMVLSDISRRKIADEKLKKIEWMLTKKHDLLADNRPEILAQDYGDLTELNQNGLIRASISADILHDIVSDYLDLLGTSSAIYEKNGDYALGVFVSGWCRLVDRASRALCSTPDNVTAVHSGKWLCHESCWRNCSKEAIASRAPVDIACNGGIRLYAVPIFVGDEVIGSMNFGYGDPPRDVAVLRRLAEDLGVDSEVLLREAQAYDSRPEYIVEMAKARIMTSARLIGAMVALKQAELGRQEMEEQFRQAQKMEAVGRLAGGVAHDFNNMLAVISGYAEMGLEKLPPTAPLYHDLEQILSASRRSADIVRQLLAFARKQVIDPVQLDLNEAVGGLLKMLGRLIGEDIDLVFKPGKNLSSVRMDPSQVDQLLANLVVNARDAISGVGKVVIASQNELVDQAYCETHPGFAITPGRYVMLVVSDDGCGMDKKIQAKIFEPFFTTKAIGKGTGLGLAMVYGIVKQNNGFIHVYSEPGVGTTFKVYLPGILEEATTAAEKLLPIAPPTGTETVLLVEDEHHLLDLAQRQLERLGYTVLTANTPTKALQVAAEFAGVIDLLLTDVVMPEMNGRELWEQLHSQRPAMKCLYMSGYTADIIARQGVLEKGVHFLQKPFMHAALAAKIRDTLTGP